MAKDWNLSQALIEGELEARVPGKMTGWLRLAGIIREHRVSVDIEGIPVAIAGHAFVLANEDPACMDLERPDNLAGELEEFRWTVDTRRADEESEESWLELDWRGESSEQAPRVELHSLYIKWRLASGETVTVEAPVSKVILLRTRKAG